MATENDLIDCDVRLRVYQHNGLETEIACSVTEFNSPRSNYHIPLDRMARYIPKKHIDAVYDWVVDYTNELIRTKNYSFGRGELVYDLVYDQRIGIIQIPRSLYDEGQ